MCDKKSETSEMVRSMVHGKPSRRQSSEPCIYDVFNWPDPQPQKNINKHDPTNQGYSTKCQQRGQGEGVNSERMNKIRENAEQNEVNQQYQVGKPKPSLKPHAIKNQLYMQEKIKIKRNLSQDIMGREDLKSKQNIPKPAKLNANDEKDKKIIERRKQKIKQFKLYTRDLPNSAFTTYYGRPPFQSYGRCNSNNNLKTHNVMPHRGQNHPHAQQTYQSALIKGKNVKVEDHLPRKPIEECKTHHQKSKKTSHNIHLPLEKPDLINHVRFSEPKPQGDCKQPVPSYEDLKKQLKKQTKQKSPRTQKSKKNSDRNSKKSFEMEDGLKFMNTRDHLIDLIEAKKIKDSRIAYKVTECYPPDASERMKTQSDCEYYERPAGMAYQKGDRAQNVIYRKY